MTAIRGNVQYKIGNSVFLLVRGAWERHLRDCVSVIPQRVTGTIVMVVEVRFLGDKILPMLNVNCECNLLNKTKFTFFET